MNKVRASLWMGVVTAAAAAMMIGVPWAIRQAKPTEQVARVRLCSVQEGRVEQTIMLGGVVRYENEYAAVSPTAGVISAVYVQPGEKVVRGQALYRMEDSMQTAAMTAALMRQFQGESLSETVHGADLSGLEKAAYLETRQTVAAASAALESLIVRAAADGVVQQVYVSRLSGTAAGSPGMLLSGEDQQIQCQAVVRDAEQLHPGMQARIMHDDELVCTASVTSVGAAEAVNGKTVCQVNLLPDAHISLPLGAAVDVVITLQAAENVPVIPAEAVGAADTVRWVADGRSYETPVSILMEDEAFCWVDLPVGTQVVVSGEGTVQGQRIREASE